MTPCFQREGAAGPIRVFLCDDTREFRTLVRHLLEEDGDIAVVGEAGDGEAGTQGVGETQPDVVLLDLAMPVCDGLETLPRLREIAPHSAVLVLSGMSAELLGPSTQRLGADGYLEKGVDPPELRRAVRAAAEPLVAY
jgi:DNA-binding NarL/FixJ family response regulator